MIRITKNMMRKTLKNYFEEDYTEGMIAKFEDYLIVDIEQWLRDNVKSYAEFLRENKPISEE